jgi:hypothetical protein
MLLYLEALSQSVGGVVLSRQFKTKDHYEAQPVTLNALLQVYIDHFRVGGDDGNDQAPLFTTSQGTSMHSGYINTGMYCNYYCYIL